MRTHGTLIKWNDDRGFGFIKSAKGDREVFVHVSAFPRDGVRPRLHELISFEIEEGSDGKQRAVRVMRPRQQARRAAAERTIRRRRTPLFGGTLTLAAMVGIGAFAYSHYMGRPAAFDAPDAVAPANSGVSSSPYSCDGRTTCSQMTSCAEAKYFLRNCPNTQMDGNNDGEPCETQWCN